MTSLGDHRATRREEQLDLPATGPACAWCRRPMAPRRRRDARTCSKACRQALHRFRVAPAARATPGERAMRFAYADPPYPGLAKRYYDSAEVDHTWLVARLVRDYPDGWALSTSAAALQSVLALCPAGVRVCPWVRGPRAPAGGNRRVRNTWEPLIVAGGRARHVAEGLDDTLLGGGRQRSHPGALTGMKPAAFAEWMFRLLGALAGDQLDDLFPGSGAIGRAWQLYQAGATRSALPSRLEERRMQLAGLAGGA